MRHHGEIIFACIVLMASVIGACPGGRLYFGNMDENKPEHVHRNGVFIQLRSDFQGFPVYKHDQREEYLYYLHGNLFGGYWAIGPEVGSTNAGISVQSRARTPEEVREVWHAWSKGRGTWDPMENTGITCVGENFMTCSSGEIHISGLAGVSNAEVQMRRMGTYRLTNITYQLRPVYLQEHPADNSKSYLFYMSGIWIIGPTVGRITGGLFSRNQAWRPEFILTPWIVFNGMQFQQARSIRVKCQAVPTSYTHPTPPDLATNVTSSEEWEGEELVAEEEEVEEAQPVQGPPGPCNPDPCLHNGVCHDMQHDTYICACTPGYFGPNCHEEVQCGEPPELPQAHVVGSTGTTLMDLTFYRCEVHIIMDSHSDQSAICQRDGQWTQPDPCDSSLGPPIEMPTHPRLEGANGRRRPRPRPRPSRPMSLVDVLEDLGGSSS